MKMIRFSKYVALVIILASVFGCDDAEMKAIDNGLYIQEAAPSNKFDQQIITQLVDDEEVVKTLTVRLVRIGIAYASPFEELYGFIIRLTTGAETLPAEIVTVFSKFRYSSGSTK